MSTAARTALIRPALGVMPSSLSALHNSMRSAPPLAAAMADSTESTQISSCMITASHSATPIKKRLDSSIETQCPARLLATPPAETQLRFQCELCKLVGCYQRSVRITRGGKFALTRYDVHATFFSLTQFP